MEVIFRSSRCRECSVLCRHAGPNRSVRDPALEDFSQLLRCPADSATTKSRGNGGEDDHQTRTPAGILYFSEYWDCHRITGCHHGHGKYWPYRGLKIRAAASQKLEEIPMDNVTLIRVVSGILAVVVLIILIYRMKKKAPR